MPEAPALQSKSRGRSSVARGIGAARLGSPTIACAPLRKLSQQDHRLPHHGTSALAISAALHPHLDRLNPEQRAAVLHGDGRVAGPLLIIAGAGSGKTNTLAHRLSHLVLEGADPRRILLMTFSRRAAAEMTRRAERIAAEILGPKAAILTQGLTWAGTFHSIGSRLLREYAPIIGLEPNFTIHDRGDAADLMNLVRHRARVLENREALPRQEDLPRHLLRAVNAQADLAQVLRAQFAWCADWEAELKALFGGYVAAKQEMGVLDFDDLLLCWATMMQEADLAAEIGARFDHVLIDEYQDTNRLQAAILAGLKPDGRGVTVVGDDAQSIYAFRAAEVRNILEFPRSFSSRRRGSSRSSRTTARPRRSSMPPTP